MATLFYGSAATNPTADTELGLTFPTAGGRDQLRYPIAIKVGEPGATIAAPKTVELKQLDGTQVIIGGLITGAVLPIIFSEITAAGTDLDLAQTTIFYK